MLKRIPTKVWIPKSSLFNIRLLSEGKKLIYESWGDPNEVVHLKHVDPLKSDLSDKDVHVEMVAAPINPADINQIQGVYAVKPTLPAVGGNEGCGIVRAVGSKVKEFTPGDMVIPACSGFVIYNFPEFFPVCGSYYRFGTWRSEAIEREDKLFKIDNRLPTEHAATIQVNPCTAYRMLEDFVKLNKKDVVVQNGANSAVGRYVIQVSLNKYRFCQVMIVRF